MVFDLKLSRTENVPWGFRLAGGADYDIALTVTKVTEGSIAEKCDLRVGDVIVRINYEPTIDLTHLGAQEMIMSCANTFTLGIRRDTEIECINAHGSLFTTNSCVSDDDMVHNDEQLVERPESAVFSEFSEMTVNSCGVDSISKEFETPKISEDHIAEIISGEAELLPEHNVIGINFQRIIPKSGLFKSSEVFKQLNEEAIKTKADKDKEVKKWTTFLQKPNRPIPKSKEQVQQVPYRVKIVKQPKPLCDPNRVRTPPQIERVQAIVDNEIKCIEKEEVLTVVAVGNEGDATIEGCHLADSEVPDLENCDPSELNACEQEQPDQNDVAIVATENVELVENANTAIEEMTSQSPIKENTVEETQLEKQLIDVQNQLAALSTLPSTIQTMLESVSRQLNEIMPAFKLRTSIDISGTINDDSTLQITEKIDFDKETNTDECVVDRIDNNGDRITTDTESQITETGNVHLEVCTNVGDAIAEQVVSVAEQDDNKLLLSNEDIARETEEQIVKMKTERVFQMQEEDWSRNKKHLSMEEKQKRIVQGIANHVPKHNNGPRTPQERPMVLPGGRKWRNPKDAYNEDFIAEIISSQAELIMGSTLGKYESPLLGYDDRVNFLKYKKPEKDLSNLDRSEVFKLIHNSETRAPNQISERAEKVYTAGDVSAASRR